MAKVSKQYTKLPYDLWIDSSDKNRKNTHNSPRIKVDVGHRQIFLVGKQILDGEIEQLIDNSTSLCYHSQAIKMI